jgi:hypothetical protein
MDEHVNFSNRKAEKSLRITEKARERSKSPRKIKNIK